VTNRAAFHSRLTIKRFGDWANAENARVHIDSEFKDKQRAFLAFVLAHYVTEAVGGNKAVRNRIRQLQRETVPDNFIVPSASSGSA
jgi:hypothetical protein